MAGDELFKRYLEIGASVLGMTRERAESIVRDLVASGEVAKGQANKAADWLVERGRAGTDELAEIVRREIRQQVAALGLATKEDLSRLEAQVEELRAAAETPPPPPATGTGTTKSAGISRSGSVRKRTGKASATGATGSSEPGAAPAPGGADSPKG
jgi:polyhydroxyalkanoate synthesis regulator phasin